MIYYAEDDKSIRDLVVYSLQKLGYAAQGFGDEKALLAAVEKTLPRLILLDIMLPQTDGISILKKLKNGAKTKDIPVIMLTAKGSEYDKVLGLECGADDYVTKPFGMMELAARIKALLRRASNAGGQEVLSAGGIALDVQKHIVTSDGAEVELTYKEFELLKMLMEKQRQRAFKRRFDGKDLGIRLQGENRTLDVHVRSLRKKLNAADDVIETVAASATGSEAER
jgi:two-component system alkaline phosphatase synthesis response regulator PhoP